MTSGEDREVKAAEWLERLQEAAALKESLVEYCRRRGLRPGEAYQWKRNLRGAGRWPALSSEAANTGRSTAVAAAAPQRFARVRIVPEDCTSLGLALRPEWQADIPPFKATSPRPFTPRCWRYTVHPLSRQASRKMTAKPSSPDAVAQTQVLIDLVTQLREGSFAPYSEQPLVRAVRLPAVTFAATAGFPYLHIG